MKKWVIAALSVALAMPATGSKSTMEVDLGRYGKHHIRLDRPYFEGDVKWSTEQEIRTPHLWIVIPCTCGITHLVLLIPEVGGGNMKYWSFDQRGSTIERNRSPFDE